ncbi:MAG: chitobiase/beta-hexosaminidase C-terminal domain-containing protein [Prevotella sp.]|nr:chitobiase/beta-hexosaminidase C-terminal domain-containing protein [Prevotella sp.]
MRRIFSLCMACLAATTLLAQQKYTLTLKSDPDGIIENYSVANGETNYLFIDDNGEYIYYTEETINLPAGAKVRLRPQSNRFRRDGRSYYRFTEQFTQQQDSPVEIEMTYDRNGDFDRADFIMPAHDVTITEHFVYDPGNISYPNPQPNLWDASTGTLIVDNIERGDWDAFRNTVPEAERDLLQKVIVSGTFMAAGMMEHLALYPNLQVVDLSRTTLTDIGSWRYRQWYDDALNALTDVLLPSTMRTINGYGFNQKPLQNLTCFAVTPPEVTATDCFTNPNMTVFVPAEAIPLYQKAPVWKDFTILPIDANASQLSVALSISDAELLRLRNMTIELVNTKTRQERRMVIGSRKDYAFRSLPVNTVYDVRLVNSRGMVLSEQQNVFVGEDDITVTFATAAIHWPHDLTVTLTVNNTPITLGDSNEPAVIWNDDKGNFLERGRTVHSVVNGQQLKMIVRLPNTNHWYYSLMEDTADVVVSDDVTEIRHNIPDVERCNYSINVYPRAASSAGDISYTVSLTQPLSSGSRNIYSGGLPGTNINSLNPREWFNYIEFWGVDDALPQGIYDITVTDRSGQYATQTKRVTVTQNGVLNFYMQPNRGQWVSTDFYYTAASSDGKASDTAAVSGASPSEPQPYADAAQLRLALRNTTTGEDISDIVRIGNGSLRLSQPIPVGTSLQLTATDPDGWFAPATATTTVMHADSTLRFNIHLQERGSILFTTPTRGTYVLLFGPDGQLAARYRCGAEIDTLFAAQTMPLPAGRYTAVGLTGGNGNLGTLLGALLTTADVQRLLTEDVDYVKNVVDIADGHNVTVLWQQVPAVRGNIQRFIDNSHTYINLAKSELVVGAYQTLRLQLAFRDEYAADISDVVVSTRDDALGNSNYSTYVAGSTMVGNSVYDFGRYGRTINLGGNWRQQIRECWMAREATDEAVLMVKVSFTYQGQTYTEYLSTDVYYIDDATMQAPATTSTPQFIASGQATPGSAIEVFDDKGFLLGTATASPNGDWMTQCTLNDSPLARLMNNSVHLVSAHITNPETGQMVITAESMVVYDEGHIRPKTVEMSFFNYHPVHMFTEHFVWDYETMQPQAKSYNFSNLAGVPTDITFTVDLTENDTTVVSQVMLWVFTTGPERYRLLECVYDKDLNRWVAKDIFNTNSLPNNIHVEVTSRRQPVMDDRQIGSLVSDLNSWQSDGQSFRTKIDELFSRMDAIIEQNRHDDEAKAEMRRLMMELCQYTGDDFAVLEARMQNFVFDEAKLSQALDEMEQFMQQYGGLYDAIYSIDLFDQRADFQVPGITITTAEGMTVASLLADGYEEMRTTGQPVYVKYNSRVVSMVSLSENIAITFDNSVVSSSRTNGPMRAGGALQDIQNGLVELWNKIDNNFDEIGAFNGIIDTIILQLETLLENSETGWQVLRESYYGYSNNWVELLDKTIIKRVSSMLKSVNCFRKGVTWFKNKLTQLKAGNWGSGMLSVISAIRNTRDAIADIARLQDFYSMIPEECPREQDKADKLRRDIYQAFLATKVFYISMLDADALNIGAAVAQAKEMQTMLGLTLNAAKCMASIMKSCAAVALNYVALKLYAEKRAALIEGFQYEVKRLECKKRDLKPGDEVDGCWRDDGDNFNIDSGQAGANLFKRHRGNNRLWQFLDWLGGGDGSGDGSNCGPKPDPDGGDNGGGNGSGNGSGRGGRRGGGDFPGGSQPILDPSGFVYEAVASNRVQGATATIYYKEEYEDMYGDKRERVVVWNAEDYAQQNPLFTDENGEYAWDVPQGLWQVKFEKQGYQTTTTDWLPVPPPQLDINVPMSQFSQPVVQRARATEQGISITFDKWMKPGTLTTENITVTHNGNVVEGTLQMLDQTYSPDSVAYVRSLRFVPSTLGAAGGASAFTLGQQLTLTVAATAESYAGVTMAEAYTQTFDVERVVETIVADSLVTMLYGQQQQINVYFTPAEAAAGKVLTVTSLNPDVATVTPTEIVLPSLGEGQGVGFTVSGKLLGTTALRLQIEQDDVEQLVIVGVKEKNDFICAEPKSSIATGSVVDLGTRLYLSSATAGTSIIYTLDGSCLCSDSGTLHVYNPQTGIVLNQDTYEVTVRCMAVAEGLEDSDEAVFIYYIRQNAQPVEPPVTIDITTAEAGYCTFFDSEHAFALPEGLTASIVVGQQDGRLVYQQLSDGIIPAATAVLIEATPRRAATFTLTSTTAADVPGGSPSGTNLLHGSDNGGWTTVDGDNYYYKLSYGPTGTSLAQRFGWFWGEAAGGAFSISGQHKGWLAVPKSAGARAYLITGEETGIDEFVNSAADAMYHDMLGRSLDHISRPGIYLQNGHKIVIK